MAKTTKKAETTHEEQRQVTISIGISTSAGRNAYDRNGDPLGGSENTSLSRNKRVPVSQVNAFVTEVFQELLKRYAA